MNRVLGRDQPQLIRSVLFHDPDGVAREAVRALLPARDGFAVAELHDRDAFLAAVDGACSDVVVLGVGDDEARLDGVRDIAVRRPHLIAVALVGAGREDLGSRALALGAEEWVSLAPDAIAALPQTIRNACTRRARALITTVLDTVEAYVVVLDAHLRLVRWNRRCPQVGGYSSDELEGRWSSIVHPEDLPRVCRALAEAAAGRSTRTEARLRTRDGDERAIVWHGDLVMGAHGRLQYLIATGIDVTEQRRTERQNAELEAELRHAQKMEAIGVLASGVAHDFSNLLTAIYGHTDLAKATLPPEHAAIRSLELVEEAAQSAEGVCRALLTFTQKSVARRAVLDLGDVVTRSTRLLRRLLPASIEFIEDVDEHGTFRVEGEATQLQQVLMNLVLNARDAMPDGGVLRLSLRHEAAEGGFGDVVLEVKDSGHGMDEETRLRVFEPFFTTKPRERGTGLGLSVLLGIVRDHGGSVDVESQVGAGTTFSVRLPLVAAVERDVPAAPGRDVGLILVAGHDAYERTIVASSLRAAGHAVIAAADADEAVAAFTLVQGDVRLLLLDAALPPAGAAADVLAAVRERAPRLPVLVLGTHGATTAPRAEGILHLHKPFRMTELMTVVQETLGSLTCIATE